LPEAYLSTAEISHAAKLSVSQVEGLINRGILLVRKARRGVRRHWAPAERDCARAFRALRHCRRVPVPTIAAFLTQLRTARTAAERQRLIDTAFLLRTPGYPGWEIRVVDSPGEEHALAAAVRSGAVTSRESLAAILGEPA
jgi:hypothetical protein